MSDIRISIHFSESDVATADLVAKLVRKVDTAVFESERELFEKALDTFGSQLDQVVQDAAKYRFKECKGKSLLVESTAPGSVVFNCVTAAVAYWVLRTTVGESFKEAWLESALHEDLKRFFRNHFDGLKTNLEKRISKINLAKAKGKASGVGTPKLELSTTSSEEGIQLKVIDPDVSTYPPPYGELLDYEPSRNQHQRDN